MTANYSGLSGSLSFGPSRIDATHPALRSALDGAVAGLPASVGVVPLGPNLSNLSVLPGIYLSLSEMQQSNRELGLGISISSAPSSACGGGSPPATGYGDDVVEDERPTLEYMPDDDGGFHRDPETIGDGTAEFSTGSLDDSGSLGR